MQHQIHNIPPVYDSSSKVLILGSFPSVKSRESQFFYGHPQNRFWKLLAALIEVPVPESIEEKKGFLLEHHIAVWDVIASCDIAGSSDSSIRNVRPNDIGNLLEQADIREIYCNGNKSHQLYQRYIEPATGRKAICLPSTSPANAAYQMDRLIEKWSVITGSL